MNGTLITIPRGAMLGFVVNTAQNKGCVLALPLTSCLSDRLGGRKVFGAGLLIVIITTVTATTLVQLIASRWRWYVQPAPLLIAELLYPIFRGKATSTYWCFYYIGAILASWARFGVQGRGILDLGEPPTILQVPHGFSFLGDGKELEGY